MHADDSFSRVNNTILRQNCDIKLRVSSCQVSVNRHIRSTKHLHTTNQTTNKTVRLLHPHAHSESPNTRKVQIKSMSVYSTLHYLPKIIQRYHQAKLLTMTRLANLPAEVLTMIVRYIHDALYSKETDVGIFTLARVSRMFRDLAILVHLGPICLGKPMSEARMAQHAICYRNHKANVTRAALLPCDRARLRYQSRLIQPYGYCVKGHARTILSGPSKSKVFCLVKRQPPRTVKV